MHAGYLRTNCGMCNDQEQDVRDTLGCNPNMAGSSPAWQMEGRKIVSFMNCPRFFIPESVLNFYDAYKGYKNARFTLPTESRQPRKYLSMCDIYESAFNESQARRSDDDRRQTEINKMPRF